MDASSRAYNKLLVLIDTSADVGLVLPSTQNKAEEERVEETAPAGGTDRRGYASPTPKSLQER